MDFYNTKSCNDYICTPTHRQISTFCLTTVRSLDLNHISVHFLFPFPTLVPMASTNTSFHSLTEAESPEHFLVFIVNTVSEGREISFPL